ncbi:DUF5047 domain-containing protein [Streptomyces sp. NPDC101393]|uniref:DUF5047 domain-containing protein n=1 Tax=Streptomyces sp. NPDC101393 TaxID=3366141 RepID=UPI0037F185E0
MQDVSDRFLPALASAHGSVVQVDVLYDGDVVSADIAITDGSVSVDRGSDIRRAASVTVPDPSVFPHLETDPFAPYGQELYIQSGIRHLDGSTELVPLGFFVITEVSGNVHTGPLTIEAQGREYLVKAEPFTVPTSTNTFATVAAFVEDAILDAIPSASFVDDSTHGVDSIPTTTFDTSKDRWAALQECAKSIGAELFVNAEGTFVLTDVPDPLVQPIVWDVTTGASGVMVSAARSLSADGVYNRVVATGENAADNVAPVMGEWTISDPTDPLRYGGPFGRRTKMFSSDLITSGAKAITAARALLLVYRSPNQTLELGTVPNPALDAGDCIRVAYANGDPPELHVVQSFDVPLAVGGQFTINTVSGREDVE